MSTSAAAASPTTQLEHKFNWCRLCMQCLTCPRGTKRIFQQNDCHCQERILPHHAKDVSEKGTTDFRFRSLKPEEVQALILLQCNMPKAHAPKIEPGLRRANICGTCQQRLRRGVDAITQNAASDSNDNDSHTDFRKRRSIRASIMDIQNRKCGGEQSPSSKASPAPLAASPSMHISLTASTTGVSFATSPAHIAPFQSLMLRQAKQQQQQQQQQPPPPPPPLPSMPASATPAYMHHPATPQYSNPHTQKSPARHHYYRHHQWQPSAGVVPMVPQRSTPSSSRHNHHYPYNYPPSYSKTHPHLNRPTAPILLHQQGKVSSPLPPLHSAVSPNSHYNRLSQQQNSNYSHSATHPPASSRLPIAPGAPISEAPLTAGSVFKRPLDWDSSHCEPATTHFNDPMPSSKRHLPLSSTTTTLGGVNSDLVHLIIIDSSSNELVNQWANHDLVVRDIFYDTYQDAPPELVFIDPSRGSVVNSRASVGALLNNVISESSAGSTTRFPTSPPPPLVLTATLLPRHPAPVWSKDLPPSASHSAASSASLASSSLSSAASTLIPFTPSPHAMITAIASNNNNCREQDAKSNLACVNNVNNNGGFRKLTRFRSTPSISSTCKKSGAGNAAVPFQVLLPPSSLLSQPGTAISLGSSPSPSLANTPLLSAPFTFACATASPSLLPTTGGISGGLTAKAAATPSLLKHEASSLSSSSSSMVSSPFLSTLPSLKFPPPSANQPYSHLLKLAPIKVPPAGDDDDDDSNKNRELLPATSNIFTDDPPTATPTTTVPSPPPSSPLITANSCKNSPSPPSPSISSSAPKDKPMSSNYPSPVSLKTTNILSAHKHTTKSSGASKKKQILIDIPAVTSGSSTSSTPTTKSGIVV